ncbi:MAG: nucleotide-binding protein [Sulfurimonas sp.]|uniref:nucleotide-binding protein n=1 Tax=Sulfurimonas sp. TaxID=2022749 RepID=UPI0028CF2B7B|nr:nucleotide-binding protein [Sulfurimonas sp.]MDT8338081.1 nucleotide-binding protein [Sulfurimonas sp.]
MYEEMRGKEGEESMSFNDEIETINSLGDYELIKYLESGLISRATGGNFEYYDYVRQKVLKNSDFQKLLPSWIKTCRDTNQFWNLIKGKFGSYQERREFIWSEFAMILNQIEFKTFSPIDETINQVSEVKTSTIQGAIMNKEKTKVFIVHGHDNETKQEVARFIESIGLETIILHEQASRSMTIIEKIEHYSSEVNFAVILYTPCDKGRGAKETNIPAKNRARQNVVFEHGYLMATIGRGNVCALVKGEVETPSDISGVVYTQIDLSGGWKIELIKELKACGYIIK